MTSLRHIALGCCVLSALAGILRLFWPENGFKSVINAVLVLYILTVGVQLVHGLDWDGLVRELRSLPDGQDTADYSDYSRELALAASVDAVREVLRNAGINAAVSWQNGVCVITPVDPRDKPAIEALNRAAGHVRTEVSKKMHIRKAPRFIFVEDDGAAYAAHINELLRTLNVNGDAEDSQPAETEE